MRFVIPLILIAITVAIFLTFTSPMYGEVGTLRTQAASYNEALSNSNTLEKERDKLTAKFNAIGGENLERLNKMLPDNVDNIRLILEIEKIASPYGMALRDVKYNTIEKTDTQVMQAGTPIPQSGDFGVWDLEFATNGSYDNFINFIKDLEKNLRIVDVASIEFSSDAPMASGTTSTSYLYHFHIKTYWLKN
jgi:Tfp pilus assembly protein PilO